MYTWPVQGFDVSSQACVLSPNLSVSLTLTLNTKHLTIHEYWRKIHIGRTYLARPSTFSSSASVLTRSVSSDTNGVL